jgi:hypothetical protein
LVPKQQLYRAQVARSPIDQGVMPSPGLCRGLSPARQ